MKRTVWTPLTLAAILVVTCTAVSSAAPPEPSSAKASSMNALLQLELASFYTTKQLNEGVYVGSEFCLACHPNMQGWRDTRHAVALRRPDARYSLVPGQGVVADHDANGVDDFIQGLDFNAISSAFDAYKPNAPILSVEGGVYYITLGELRLRVIATQGGTGVWKQRYLVAVPVASGGINGYSAENYLSPVQFNEKTGEYVAYRPQYWYDANNQPRFNSSSNAAQLARRNPGSFTKDCIGCHTTGVQSITQTNAGEWFYEPFVATIFDRDDPAYFDYNRDGFSDLVNIGCEACHGPGSLHILGGGDPSKIVNPAELDTTQANEVCGQCHLRVESVPNGTHDWPYDDEEGRMWLPGRGEPLAALFTDASGRWPDGINSRQNHQQYFDFLASEKPDFPFHPVRCDECHDVHGDTTNRFLIRDVIEDDGVTMRTADENDTLCLACHAGFGDFADLSKEDVAEFEVNREKIGAVVAGHSRHPFYPERRMGLSRCSSCHMPKIAQSAVEYDIHSHSFEAIPPEKNLAYQNQGGMPDSCSVSCHNIRVNIFDLGIDNDLGEWTSRFDRRAARQLLRWFGPDGLWWDTGDSESATSQNLEAAALPGEVPRLTDEDLD